MFCPKCKSEYREGFTICAKCDVTLIAELPPEKKNSYVSMKKLYKPQNEVELSLIRSIFESEGIQYFVHNDHFGSLQIGPQIDLFNARMVMVPEHQYAKAQELLSNYLENIKAEESETFKSQYSLADKIRMLVEGLLFTWIVPGRRRKKTNGNDEL